MKKIISAKTMKHHINSDESGQSIVLIAFMLIGILAFAGLAVDLGFWMARASKLQAAVDSAALAGVTELTTGTKNDADEKAVQFLNANGVPITVTQSFDSVAAVTTLGEREYAITVTWDVELFFMKIINREIAPVTRSATAAYFPLADIYVSSRVDTGVLATSNQSVFGPNICINFGDPYSPLGSPWFPGLYSYKYRIMIPESYVDQFSELQVELFDPDSINQDGNSEEVAFSPVAQQWSIENPSSSKKYPAVPTSLSCGGSQMGACLIDTKEDWLIGRQLDSGYTITENDINPNWFRRVDENRGSGSGNGNGGCGQPGNYTARYNTATNYSLYYYQQSSDGAIKKVDLASYTGQVGDGVRDNGDHNTDMRWVSPGVTAGVPVDPGSPNSFVLNISEDLAITDVPNILVEPGSGVRYIYMDVTTLSGASENGYEIWAGPSIYSVNDNVNARNLALLADPAAHTSRGAIVYGIGNLPMNSNSRNAVEIPLVYVGPEYAGQDVFVSLFDSDSGAKPPIIFHLDTIAYATDSSSDGVDWDKTDWAMSFGGSGVPDPDGGTGRCKPGGCGTRWVDPAYRITIPGDLENCDPAVDPNSSSCTPFYGGRLMARYIGGDGDTYVWEIAMSGIPYLVR